MERAKKEELTVKDFNKVLPAGEAEQILFADESDDDNQNRLFIKGQSKLE